MELILQYLAMRAKGLARKIHQPNQSESEKHPQCKLEFYVLKGK